MIYSGRFDSLLTLLDTADGMTGRLNRPARALRQFRQAVAYLCYSPVWEEDLALAEQWLARPIATDYFKALGLRTQSEAPEYNAEISREAREVLPRALILRSLHKGSLACVDRLAARSEILATPSLEPSCSFEQWLSSTVFPQKDFVASTLRRWRIGHPIAVRTLLLHGSLADGRVEDGYSDWDIHVIADIPTHSDDFIELAGWLYSANGPLLRFNPCMHHGPMLVFTDELRTPSEWILPSCLIEEGVIIWGDLPKLGYVEDLDGALAAFAMFENFFDRTLINRSQICSAFDAIWWIASCAILPSILFQLRHGTSLRKARVFSEPNIFLPEDIGKFIRILDDLRRQLARWLRKHPARNGALADLQGYSPGIIKSVFRGKYHLSADALDEIGVTEEIFQLGRSFWREISAQALELIGPCVRMQPMRLLGAGWPQRITDLPIRANLHAYDVARLEFLRCAERESTVSAVFEFGNIGCPGLSDLDLLVVLDDAAQGVPHALTIEGLQKEIVAVLGHDPLFVSQQAFPLLRHLFPLFAARQLAGAAMAAELSLHLDEVDFALLATYVTASKYPHDPIYLGTERETRYRTWLAYLNSIGHIAVCLEHMGIPLANEIKSAQSLNNQIRRDFARTEAVSASSLSQVAYLVLRASWAALCGLEHYWRQRKPELNAVLPSFDEAIYWQEIEAAAAAGASHWNTTPPAVQLLCIALTQQEREHLPESHTTSVVSSLVAQSRKNRTAFIRCEQRLGREISPYIASSRFRCMPPDALPAAQLASLDQLQSACFRRFMFHLNGFAIEHGLRPMLDWSKAWEYPWLWYSTLQKLAWDELSVLDVGSELSPMPWFFATLGARVSLVEVTAEWVPVWEQLRKKLGVAVDWHIVDNLRSFKDDEFDVVTSFSVIEHQTNRSKAIDEVFRVLKRDGTLAMSFDICEPQLGMTFPEWNGTALSLLDFERIVWAHPAAGNRFAPTWNTDDMARFQTWKLRSAPHHNYVVGAAVLQKTSKWQRTDQRDRASSSFATDIAFHDSRRPLLVKEMCGLSAVESWGRWSDANLSPSVLIRFAIPLPQNLILDIRMRAFGENVGKPVVIRVGDEETFLVLSEQDSDYTLNFKNCSDADVIEMVPPNPMSPKERGWSDDHRKLGIGFVSLSITTGVQLQGK